MIYNIMNLEFILMFLCHQEQSEPSPNGLCRVRPQGAPLLGPLLVQQLENDPHASQLQPEVPRVLLDHVHYLPHLLQTTLLALDLGVVENCAQREYTS